jgi:CRISPR-associated protein Csm4
MSIKIVKLIPKSNSLFHFGIKGLDETETIFHSDSLFSAIVNNYAKINGRESVEEDRLKEFFPAISSLFHFIKVEKNGKEIGELYFVPKPFVKLEVFDEYPEEQSKEIKKVEFVSLDILKILSNKKGKIDSGKLKNYTISGNYLVSDKEFKLLGLDKIEKNTQRNRIYGEIKITDMIKEQKVTVSRDFSKDNKPFVEEHFQMCESAYYVPQEREGRKDEYTFKSGFYFLIDGLNNENPLHKKILQAIYLIKDEGLGGERSTGKGLFEDIKIDKFDKLNDIGHIDNGYMALSLIFPNKENEEYRDAENFDLIERKGFVYSPFSYVEYRKRGVVMFREGSIFNKRVNGDIATVVKKDEVGHDVYRYGKAFLIPLKPKGDESA